MLLPETVCIYLQCGQTEESDSSALEELVVFDTTACIQTHQFRFGRKGVTGGENKEELGRFLLLLLLFIKTERRNISNGKLLQTKLLTTFGSLYFFFFIQMRLDASLFFTHINPLARYQTELTTFCTVLSEKLED